MEHFVERHKDRILGILSGFDRVLFRGTLRSINYEQGMDVLFARQKVLKKDFDAYAQQVSERIKEHAKSITEKAGRPYQYLQSSKISKEQVAREILQKDNIEDGLICVLACIEPCKSCTVRKDHDSGKLRFYFLERKCLHLYFYFIDRDLGFMHLRLETWLPLSIQVCFNGREYLARRMDRAGMAYQRHDNCFSQIEKLPQAQKWLDDLGTRKWARRLNAMARRVNPWIHPSCKWDLHGYYWSIRECEFATDVMFQDTAALQAIYPALVRHAIDHFHTPDVLRFFGRTTNHAFAGEAQSSLKRRVEGVRVKHWVDENSIKMYDKAGSVLRVEVTINNPRRFRVHRSTTRKGHPVMAWIPMRTGIADISRRVDISRAANERYLEALSVVGCPQPTHRLLDSVSKPVVVQQRRYRPLQPISPKEARCFCILLDGRFLLQGFRNEDVRQRLEPEAKDPIERRRSCARTCRLLRLLRAHGLVFKVPKTNYYRITKKGREVMTTATTFRNTDIALLAA